jgi:hypothetical protein
MARTRTGGNTAYAVALVLFVILFLFAAVLAVLIYTQYNKAVLAQTTAERDLKTVATGQEIQTLNAEYKERRDRDPGRTLVSLQRDDLRYLKTKIANLGDRSIEEVRGQLATAGVTDESGSTLVSELSKARDTARFQESKATEAAAAAQGAESRATTAEARAKDLEKQYEEARTQLAERVAAFEKLNNDYKALVDKQRTDLQTEAVAARTSQSELVAQKDSEIQALRTENIAMADEIRRLQNKQRFEPPDPSTAVDGEIASILTEESLVYINRGREHHVIEGMTFEVFDKITGVVKNAVGDARGKATIEVININPTSSVARIVRQNRGTAVVAGDLIVNAVYDPNTTFKFVVFGEFDLDRSGTPSLGDRRRVETMITEWGGALAEELTYDTDFLVLGQEPKLPDPLDPSILDPVRIEQNAAEMRRYKTYNDLIAQAKELKIPVLNQNRFLILVGYYKR